MPKVIGEPARPQVLFIGFLEEDPELQAMVRMVPKAAVYPHAVIDWLVTTRTAEWDVVVSCQPGASLTWIPSAMQVLAFNGSGTGYLARRLDSGDGWGDSIEFLPSGGQPSTVLRLDIDGIPDAIARLVTSELVPWLNQLEQRPTWVAQSTRQAAITSIGRPAASLLGHAIVRDADHSIIAGMFQRAADYTRAGAADSMALMVPHMPPKPSLWFAAMLEYWSAHDTDGRFADLPSWKAAAEYQSTTERRAASALADHDEAHASAVQAYEQRRLELAANVEAARVEADQGARQLLTAHDDSLVAAVKAALGSMGFVVTDMDALVAPGTAKMEDLRVEDPSATGWTNITEVKGYTRGAKTSVLLDIARFAANYLREKQTLPTSRWYVVNQFREDPPDSRPEPLPGAAADVASFALDGGLVIDTRRLFSLARMVEDGTLKPEDARKSLRQSTGIYDLPDTSHP